MVKNDGNIQKIGIIICLYTGIHIGEVCALKWEDVQFENAVLHIYKTVYRTKDFSKNNRKTKLIVKETKSKHSVRYIPLGSTLLEYLKKYRQEDSCFALTGNSEKPLDPRTYQNQFYSYLEKCNIKRIKFHILRQPKVKSKTKILYSFLQKIFYFPFDLYAIFFKNIDFINKDVN